MCGSVDIYNWILIFYLVKIDWMNKFEFDRYIYV